MRWSWAGLVVVAAQSSARPTLACIPGATDFTIASTQPARGASDVRLNAPLVVRFSQAGLSRAASEPPPVLSLRRAGQSPAQTLAPHELYDSTGTTWVFLPNPLEPNADYEASLETTLGGEVRNQGWSFRTGSSSEPPTRLLGELRVSFHAGVDPVQRCEVGLCERKCEQTGEIKVIKARVEFPDMVDGFPHYFAQGELFISQAGFTNERLTAYRHPYLVPLEGPAFRITMPLFEGGGSYAPCFRYTVTDARLDSDTRSLCLDQPFALDEPTAPTAPAPESGPRTSQSCAWQPARPAAAPWLVVLAFWLTRRWRALQRLGPQRPLPGVRASTL